MLRKTTPAGLHHPAHYTAGLARTAAPGPLSRLLSRLLPRRAFG
jgi:hypothetical protein